MVDGSIQPGREGRAQDRHAGEITGRVPEAVDEPKSCVHCGYCLEYLPGERCPECGETYYLYDLRSYDGGPFPRERRFPRTTWGAVLTVFLLMLAVLGVCRLVIEWMRYAIR